MVAVQRLIVAEKKKDKISLSLPPAMIEAFYEAAEPLGGKEKWIALAAAVLLLIEDSERRTAAIRRIQEANMVGGSFDELVKDARAGPTGKPVRLAAKPEPPRGKA